VRALELKVPPVAWFVAAAAAMWLLGMLMPIGAFSFPGQLLVASLLLLAGGLLGLAGVRAFLRAGTTANPMEPTRVSRLVVNGIYRHTRNAMYLALLLALIAWGVWLGNLVALLLVAGSFVLVMNRWQIQPEERALEALFGEEFRAYKRQVRRWL
jgi:protein-S-isoprenylcysteine O-methyltransferase Ste14